jgi:ABC-2 type transport system permease protein
VDEPNVVPSAPARQQITGPAGVLRYVRIVAVFYRTSIQAEMEYRADFLARVLASLLGLLTTIGSLSIAYSYTDNLRGWTFSEAMVLLSVYYLMDGLIEMLIGPNMRQITTQVREGTLDFVLLKPLDAQFMASFRSLNIWRAASAIIGLGLSIYTIGRLSIGTGLLQAMGFAATLAAGLAIIYSFWLFLVTLTFWFVRVDNVEQIVWQAFEAGRYPVEIYPRWLQGTLTYVIPVAFVITVPARALAGRLTGLTVVVALVLAACMLALVRLFWRVGLRNYTGASA